MSIVTSEDGMTLSYNGNKIHSHHSNKAWSNDQVQRSVQAVINSRMDQPAREKIIRQGGDTKTAMDAYFDSYVSGLKATLMAAAELHREALSYERMLGREVYLSDRLNGYPEQVSEDYIDDAGEPATRMIDNPLREGFEVGHVMLDGLPLQIEVNVYDDAGEVTGTEMIDNPERMRVTEEYATVVSGLFKTAANAEVMTIVGNRNAG